MTTKSVQINENERIHFFFPDFNEDNAIIKERRMEHDWKVEPMMVLPRVLLENITSIRLQDDVEFDYKQFTADFYRNREDVLQLVVSDKTPMSRAILAHFCEYQLCCNPLYEKQECIFRDAESIRFIWCVNDDETDCAKNNDGDWAGDSLSPSVFGNLVIDSKNGKRDLTTVKETPAKQLRDYQTYAPKKSNEVVKSILHRGPAKRSLTYDKVNDLESLWLNLESEDSNQKSHPIRQEKEKQQKIDSPVVIDLTGESDDEVEMAPMSSMDSDKENREPQFSREEGNSLPPPQEQYLSSEKLETPLA